MLVLFLVPQLVWADFGDIPTGSALDSVLQYLEEKNLIETGQGQAFNSEKQVSWGEFLNFVLERRTVDTTGIKVPYLNVRQGGSYYNSVKKALKLGLLETKTKSYGYGYKITRLEALDFLFRFYQISYSDAVLPARWTYWDIDSGSRYAKLVQKVLELELIKPKATTRFGAADVLMRGELAKMIYGLELHAEGKAPPIEPKPMQIQIQFSPATFQYGTDIVNLDIFRSVWEALNSIYLHQDKINRNELMYGAIKGMIEKTEDPYTAYFTPEEAAAFTTDLSGDLEGIGAHVTQEPDGTIMIVAPIRSSPAEKAGLKAGDIIQKVDGQVIQGRSLGEAVKKIKGPAGTSVVLTIIRGEAVFDVRVVREKVTVVSASWKEEREGIYLIQLSQFAQNAYAEWRAAVQAILAKHSEPNRENRTTTTLRPKGIIIDMRNNPGGFLDVAKAILGDLLPSGSTGLIIKTTRRLQEEKIEGDELLKDIPIAVLVNRGSASASEIVAGAIQDLKRGQIIGEKTFGKGTVQQLFSYRDGSSLKVTIANWLTPLGREIDGHGVDPDVLMEDKLAIGNATDALVDRAVWYLQGEGRIR